MCGTIGLVASFTSLSSAMCECASMMPGVRYLPPASTTVTPAGALTFGPTAAILPPRTSTLPLAILPCVTVMTTAFLMSTSCAAPGGGVDCACDCATAG